MKKIISVITLFAVCASLASCGVKEQERGTAEAENAELSILDTMTLEEKVGQMLFIRYPDINLEDLLSKNPGGILMFQRDFDNLTRDEVIAKIENLQSESKIPLIIGADEEGGTVVRVSANLNLADAPYKSPQDIFAEGGMEAVNENTREKSELLLSLGINMNLAPVADVSTDPETFIYKRSFGQGYEETADFVAQTVSVMNESGIWSTLKHFPGYGEVTGDTHKGEVRNKGKTLDEMRETDFLPFKAGIDAGADSVLVSHNVYESIDSENPASLSPIVHEILRNELGFDGVIMTDDIAMGAVSDMEKVYIKAVNAGNDLLITTDYETAYNEILEAARNGEIDEETINNAVERILKMKGLLY